MVFLSQKVDGNMIFTDYLKSFWFNLFKNGKYGLYLSQKVDGNIFTDHWKVLVLTFSEMGNTVFLWVKKLK